MIIALDGFIQCACSIIYDFDSFYDPNCKTSNSLKHCLLFFQIFLTFTFCYAIKIHYCRSSLASCVCVYIKNYRYIPKDNKWHFQSGALLFILYGPFFMSKRPWIRLVVICFCFSYLFFLRVKWFELDFDVQVLNGSSSPFFFAATFTYICVWVVLISCWFIDKIEWILWRGINILI